MTRAYLSATTFEAPVAVLSNEQLEADFGNWTSEQILKKTGIALRHVVSPGECASDLACRAAEKLFVSGACAASDVDYTLFCTQSPDHFLPTTACLIQERLGIPKESGALDYNLGCSGFVYGLGLAKGLVETGQARRVLLLTAETYSRYIHPKDRSVRTLFGDAGAATLVEGAPGEAEEDLIGPFVFGTDGRGGEHLIVPRGAMRLPRGERPSEACEDEHGNWRSDENLYMNGAEIFAFTLEVVPGCVERMLSRAGLRRDDVDLFVFHQANQYMLEHLRKKIGIPAERFVVALREHGNTVCATIPIALRHAVDDGRLRKGMRVMLVGFGVGYSWAAAMIRWRA